ncbi:MAG TPA: hypothetical protein VEL31_13355 [Ktedonobacteraceae bacterium]|nr:hypothetical protein [Ktedonobacteraceae bacterium]
MGVQHKGALTSFLGQKDHEASDPTWTNGMIALWQIGKRNHCTVCRRCGFRAGQVAGVNAQKDVLTRAGKRRELDKDLAQPRSLDLAVFKGFLRAGPFPWKKRRERQLRKAVGCRFTAEAHPSC